MTSTVKGELPSLMNFDKGIGGRGGGVNKGKKLLKRNTVPGGATFLPEFWRSNLTCAVVRIMH